MQIFQGKHCWFYLKWIVGVADGENNTNQGLSAYVDMVEAFLLHDTNEQTADMIEEPRSVFPNLDIAGKYGTKLLWQAIKFLCRKWIYTWKCLLSSFV